MSSKDLKHNIIIYYIYLSHNTFRLAMGSRACTRKQVSPVARLRSEVSKVSNPVFTSIDTQVGAPD